MTKKQKDVLILTKKLQEIDNGRKTHKEVARDIINAGYSKADDVIAENERLKRNYDELYKHKRALEDELIERGFAEYAHGNFRLLSDDEKEQVRKETAKKAYLLLDEAFKRADKVDEAGLAVAMIIIMDYFGVEVAE